MNATELLVAAIVLAFLATTSIFVSQVPRLAARRTNLRARLDHIMGPDERERARLLVGSTAEERPATAPAMLPDPVRRRFLQKDQEFAHAGIALTATEYYLAQFGLVAVGVSVAGLLGGGIIALILTACATIALPNVWVRYLKAQRLAQFTKQLEPAMRTATNSLRAGQSLEDAIHLIAEKIPAPLGTEFAKASREIVNANIPPLDALAHIQERTGSALFGWIVDALRLQKTIGGNLLVIFENVADTVRERVNLRDSVKAKTAQGRTGGYVVAVMPFAMTGVVTMSDPTYMQPFFSTLHGEILITLLFLLIIAGVVIITRMTDIRIEKD